MAITTNDIKVYKSERMTDDDNGGGQITGDEVTCGQLNNVFPNISRMDRLYGRTQFRKIFPKIISQDTDTYSGAHFIISDPPDDENVNIIMFDNGTPTDERSDMISFFESYFTSGISAGTATLAYEAELGTEILIFEIANVDRYFVYRIDAYGVGHYIWEGDTITYTLNVNAGDVIYIGTEYLMISKTETIKEDIVNIPNSREYYKKYKVLTLTKPTTEVHAVGSVAYTRQINTDWHCYGTMRLSQDVSIGDYNLPVVSEKITVMPTIEQIITISSSSSQMPDSVIVNGLTVGEPPYTYIIDGVLQPYIGEYELVDPGATMYVYTVQRPPIVEGSVIIYFRNNGSWSQAVDDGASAIQGFATGSVEYADGVITIAPDSVPDENTHILFFYRTEKSYKEYVNIPVGDPGAPPLSLNFTQTDLVESSVFIEMDLEDSFGEIKTFSFVDDGQGNIVANTRYFLDMTPDFSGATYDGMNIATISSLAHGNGRFWLPNSRWVSQYISMDCVEWEYESENPGGSIVNGRMGFCPFISYETMFYVGENSNNGDYRVLRKADITDSWHTVTLPNTNHRCDVAHLAVGQGIWVIVTMHDSQIPIFSTDDGLTFSEAASGATPMRRVCAGLDKDSAARMFIGSGTNTYKSYDGDTWAVINEASTGATCIEIDYAIFQNTWIVATATSLMRSTDGGETWGNIANSIEEQVPEILGKNICDIACSPDGKWVVTYDFTGEDRCFCAISGNNGDNWVAYEPDFGDWGDLNKFCGGFYVAYDMDHQKFGLVMREYGSNSHLRSNSCDVVAYFTIEAGTIDYEAGTAQITLNTDYVYETILATYFMTYHFLNDFCIIIECVPPIIADTLSISATKASDGTTMTISEVGGASVGDGTMTINHEHGYAFGTFNEPYIPDTITTSCQGSAIFHPQYDEYDTGRMPVDGLVPACKSGDTIIISDGVNTDFAIVTKVTNQLLTIAVDGGLSHNYSAGTLISAAVVVGDLQALENTYFSESIWPGGWYDEMQGVPADGSWDSTNYPATVTNKGAITEKWAITVTQAAPTVLVQVEGENVGIVLTDFDIHSGALEPINPAQTPEPYFSVPAAAWSAVGTHQVDNVYRFNTTGTERPLWLCRSINARASDVTSDSTTLEIRGDVD